MRFITTLVLGTALALPAMAQTTHMKAKPHHTMRHSGATGRQTVEDKGPFTPEANRAYNGGGMVMETAPGGQTPMPMR